MRVISHFSLHNGYLVCQVCSLLHTSQVILRTSHHHRPFQGLRHLYLQNRDVAGLFGPVLLCTHKSLLQTSITTKYFRTTYQYASICVTLFLWLSRTVDILISNALNTLRLVYLRTDESNRIKTTIHWLHCCYRITWTRINESDHTNDRTRNTALSLLYHPCEDDRSIQGYSKWLSGF